MRRGFAMTIGKRLYLGFGIILGVLTLLFFVNLITGSRQSSATKEAAQALDSYKVLESVRNQIMLNRLNLNNFLLSGDPRDEEKVNKGMIELADTLKRSEAQVGIESLRLALIQVESTESSWIDNFAKPLLAKRHQVDSGDATVSDLQIFYLQKDPASWLTKSASVLDQANSNIGSALDESQRAAKSASKISFFIIILGTLVAIAFGIDRAV